MLTSGLISSTFVSDLYGFIHRILYLIFGRPYCKFTLTLVKHCVLKNGSVQRVLYFYAVWLLSMSLSTTL